MEQLCAHQLELLLTSMGLPLASVCHSAPVATLLLRQAFLLLQLETVWRQSIALHLVRILCDRDYRAPLAELLLAVYSSIVA